MNLAHMIQTIKSHPDINKAGMILSHNGIVRQTARDGRKVTGLQVTVDYERLDRILSEYKKTPGIVEILIDIADGRPLAVGDDVMFLVVAGNVRETVISTLAGVLDEVKTTVTTKTEYFAD